MKQIEAIFRQLQLPAPRTVHKIAVGFTNQVYEIDGQYVLKICIVPENEEPFAREAVLNEYFEGLLPVPGLLIHDASKTILEHDYTVCTKLPGVNLYNVWHTFSHGQRAALIEQLCSMLRTINATDLSALPPGTVPPLDNWKEYIAGQIEGHLAACEAAGTLSREFCTSIRGYVAENIGVLDVAKVALTYYDPHFDNLLVKNGHITGLLDLERTEIASIDYVLDLVWRMVRKPTKYMSEFAKLTAQPKDYADLMYLYGEAYPELFNFDELQIRLNLYEIAHDLRDLKLWRELKLGYQRPQLAAGLARIVKSPVDI